MHQNEQNGPKLTKMARTQLAKISGALRHGSLTKMVILLLNWNGLFNHLKIWHVGITYARKPLEVIKFGLW